MAFEDPSPSHPLRMTNCVATAASAVGGRSGRRYTGNSDGSPAFFHGLSARDPSPAEATVAVVHHHGLAGGDGAELLREREARAVAVERRHGRGDVRGAR